MPAVFPYLADFKGERGRALRRGLLPSCVSEHSGARALQLQRRGIALPNTYATPRHAIFLHPLLASCLPCDAKLEGHCTAGSEVHLVGSLTLERRVRHDFVMGRYVELDETS